MKTSVGVGGFLFACWQLVAAPATAAPCVVSGGDLIVDGITCELSGVHQLGSVSITNNGQVTVLAYDGGDKTLTGNLELRAESIFVDATSRIVARGSGYQTRICGDGAGPTATAGGRGGCAVRDSGGGGAHFGRGGRGTKDISGTQSFPRDFEEDCGNSVAYDVDGEPSCSVTTNCRNNDGLPTVAGSEFWHSVYVPEFGASGGDKGCRDGDGTTLATAGSGGGRIVLAAVNANGTGTMIVNGTINANGKRGCGNGNDSAGGGAGGTIFLVADNVQIGASASITSAGGLGGDTSGASDPTGECVPPFQQSGTCDDCGGGGGGGLISVLSGNAIIEDESVFNVNGALGGVCPICRGEAGGGVGELQISGGYVGEVCDGFDNDFDDAIDEDFGTLACGLSSVPACLGGIPQQCPNDLPGCIGPVTDTRARFAVIVDTSGSMLGSLTGVPTFGDGSSDRPGLDQDGNGLADDSRLFKAKGALTTVISAYPEIDFALARYHQDTSLNRSCQMAAWFECNNICCSYDNPTNNTGAQACTTNGGTLGTIPVRRTSPGDECINYAGNCGAPRRGADVLAGFGSDINQYLAWLDGAETNYLPDETVGSYCGGASGDCELRGTGPTPLANSLQAVQDYLTPIKGCDAASIGSCRRYGVILLTDGSESCQGDPVAAAAALRAEGIDTFVVGFSVLPTENAQLNAIAAAGGTGAAFLVGNEDQLANALASIVSSSIVFETCNELDDDCDGAVDEDFPLKGSTCDDGELGTCRGTGAYVCAVDGSGVARNITDPGADPVAETCNGLDDDCDGAIDEGIICSPGCVPTSPVDNCDGLDNDCDGQYEEDDPDVGNACGTSNVPPCSLGTVTCISGQLICIGASEPGVETCNNLDDDCDGIADDAAQCPGTTSCVEGGCRLLCLGGEFPCPSGFDCETTPNGDFCVPSACAACAPNEVCENNACVDPCADVVCDVPKTCRLGTCVDCNILGCPAAEICLSQVCVADPCAAVDCEATCTDPQGCSCYAGACQPNCADAECPDGQHCLPDGTCAPDLCDGVACQGYEVCNAGQCVDAACGTFGCGAGLICDRGACIDDPCKLLECSSEYRCVVRDSVAVCQPKVPVVPPDLVGAGGGGCASASPSMLALLMVAVAFVLRRTRGRDGTLIAVVAAVAVSACNISAYDLSRQGKPDDARGDGGGLVIDANPNGTVDAPGCVPTGVDDTCDEIDNDCNGVIDDMFDKQQDGNNCGTCGQRCVAAGAIQACEAGSCAFVACQPGFADLDGDGLTCEYMCPLFPAIPEDCNGVDDNCDGLIDNMLPAPPTGQCRNVAGTLCAGTQMICATRGGVTTWYCDYAAGVEFDPTIPNGIVLQEQRCDGIDGDCDAVVDDAFVGLGQACDDGGIGVCRDVGIQRCDPLDPSQVRCDLSVLPDAQAPSAEQCDNLDNNCNGTIDEAEGDTRVIDAMTWISFGANDFYIDTYEASRPDATATVVGAASHRACSNAGVMPWRGATFATASAACAAAGKVLCTAAQWQAACEGATNLTYPYGNAFAGDTCNTESYDGIDGGADDDVLLATGSALMCSASTGVFDLSGNVKEWTNEITGQANNVDIAVLRGGAYDTPGLGATCDFRTSRATVDTVLPTIGFRCCKATAP